MKTQDMVVVAFTKKQAVAVETALKAMLGKGVDGVSRALEELRVAKNEVQDEVDADT